MIAIIPRERVGRLAFGMTRSETRATLGARGEVFRRAPHEPTASDLHDEAGLVLSFDLDGRLHTVEMTPRAEPTVHGLPLSGPLDEVHDRLRAAGATPRPDTDSLAVPEWGLVVGAGSVLASVSDHVVFDFDFFPGGPPSVSPGVVTAAGFAPGVRIGARRAELRELLGGGVASVPDIGGAGQDHFMGTGIVATYDEDDVVIRLTATAPAQPEFEGLTLIGRTWDELLVDAAARGIETVVGEADIEIPAGGFRVWPLLVSGTHPIVAVSVPA